MPPATLAEAAVGVSGRQFNGANAVRQVSTPQGCLTAAPYPVMLQKQL